MITHLVLMKQECQQLGLPNVLAKLCVCLLRYTKEIRADKAYLDAGRACRAAGQYDSAFIYFNRYIDLYDAIDDPDNAGGIDNTEFENTDIPSPFEIPLPEKNIITPEERDQIRDWVLEINMDGSVGQSLPTRRCEHCGGELHECSLTCPHCRATWEPCIISGMPLVKADTVQCKICSKGAIREHWNDYIGVTMHCPWCKSMQT